MKNKEIKQATKDKIFQVAAELFSRDGYYKVSVREICEAAGVTKPVLYYYFEDKENLLLEMVKETRRIVERLITKYIEPNSLITKQLEGIINLYLEFIDNYPHLMRFSMFIQFMIVPERVKQFNDEIEKKDWMELIELFGSAQLKGELKPGVNPKILVHNFIGSVIMILSQYMMNYMGKDKFKNELYEFLEFWKHQFVIDKKN